MSIISSDRFVIVGCGKSGISAINFLLKLKKKVFLYDDNNENLNRTLRQYSNKVKLFNINDSNLNDVFVFTPGICISASKHKLVEHCNQIEAKKISMFDLFKAKLNNKSCLVGITGTNGKSTTTILTYHLAKAIGLNVAYGGNIGIPFFDIEPQNAQHYILEMSSAELGNSISPSCDIALVNNIYPYHIKHHGGLNDYISAKLSIIKDKDGVGIINKDCCFSMERAIVGKKYFSTKEIVNDGISIINNNIYLDGKMVAEEFKIPTSLYGAHNVSNLAASLCLLSEMCKQNSEQLNFKIIQDSVLTFAGLEHRCEHFLENDGIHFVNDSKSTNALSLAALLDSYAKNRNGLFLIFGGMVDPSACKEGDGISFELEGIFKRYSNKIAKIFIIGEVADRIARGHHNALDKLSIDNTLSHTLEKAVTQACQEAKRSPHDNKFVIFAPAHQSFDQFKNFEHRGEVFKSLVKSAMNK